MAVTDLPYERMKIIGVMTDTRNRVEYYKDALEGEGTADDKQSLDWARKAFEALSALTLELIIQH